LLTDIEETERKMDANLKRMVEMKGSSEAYVLTGARRTNLNRLITTTALVVLGMMRPCGGLYDL
jgi:hypothetical protein